MPERYNISLPDGLHDEARKLTPRRPFSRLMAWLLRRFCRDSEAQKAWQAEDKSHE